MISPQRRALRRAAGQYLCFLRELAGLTQLELATKCGVHPSRLAKLELGEVSGPYWLVLRQIGFELYERERELRVKPPPKPRQRPAFRRGRKQSWPLSP